MKPRPMFVAYLAARRVRAQLMGIVLVGSLGLVTRTAAMRIPALTVHSTAALPTAFLVPLVPAVILGQGTRSEARQSEEAGVRSLRIERLAHVSAFEFLAVTSCVIAGGQAAGASIRNTLGFCGIVLLTAVLLGSEWSWFVVSPLVMGAPLVARTSVDSYAWWAWFLRPVSPDTSLVAGALAAIGLVCFVVGNSRVDRQTEAAAQ